MKTVKSNSRAYCPMSAVRYARVLFDMGLPEEVIGEAEEILESSPELALVLESPVVTKDEKHRVIDRIFDTRIRNFLKVTTDYGKAGIVQDIFRAYHQYKNEMAGIVTAHLAYLVPPTEEQKKGMEQFVCREFHAKGVLWEMEERPSLIGGFLLLVNGREYDYSMQGRLKRLEQKLTWR